MNFTQIRLILKQPLPLILAKVRTVIIEKIEGVYWNNKYSNNEFRKPNNQLQIETGLVDFQKIIKEDLDKDVAEYLTNMYLSHRFDLLGTGWVKNSYHSESIGIEGIKFDSQFSELELDNEGKWLTQIVGTSHLVKSKEIWTKILATNGDYFPIDWQKDYKSGFRFSAKLAYHKQAQLVTTEGIDLKMPWELSRFQHLPQLALFADVLPDKKTEIITEFRNQVLDFIMTNPPGMGVNWNCTMDVGIRAANLLLAYDWFTQIDSTNVLDDYFNKLFIEYIHWHGKHIINNFEYKEGLTSNHYLGNVAGLSFVSSYLYGTEYLNEWLMLSVQELNNEMPKQFFSDGANFEGSTAYHRLSGEMFAYSTAVVNSLPASRVRELEKIKRTARLKKPKLKLNGKDFKFGDGVFSELYYSFFGRMLQFSQAYRKIDGSIVQIGDNDSGRFFRLSPNGEFLDIENAFRKYKNLTQNEDYKEARYWDENHINHDPFIVTLNAFVANGNEENNDISFRVEQSFINQLIAKKTNFKKDNQLVETKKNPQLDQEQEKEFKVQNGGVSLLEGITHSYFPDFGMITFRSKRLFLNVAFGNNRKSHHSWGHQHNDKLSVDINIDGVDQVFDPGTYIYTPLPEKRNLFRSTKYHNTIDTGEEQNTFNKTRRGLFTLNREIEVEVLRLTPSECVLSAQYRGIHHIRKIEIKDDRIVIQDSCNKKFNQHFNTSVFSNGYGKLVNL